MTQHNIYFTFTLPPVSGGHFVALEQIAALNTMGFNAKVYYVGAPDGLDKFPVPAVRAGAPLSADDIIVVGEDNKKLLRDLKSLSCIKVLFNQNPYYTFVGFDSAADLASYPFAAVIAPSDFCAAQMKAMGVTHAIHRVRPAVPDYFTPGEKKLQIAFAPRKRQVEALYLKSCFGARFPDYAHVPWAPLVNVSRRDCAKVMNQSAIFAALPHLESLGLTSLEAMAAGCHVVGYTGHGGAEYAMSGNGDWIGDGDHDTFVEKLRDACRLFESGQRNPKLEAGRATATAFSRDGFERELAAAWHAILGDRIALYRNA
ncbi:MAG TPA: glycosyltransferase [Rhizomicrobium sp.]|nr:glycosyltransferase [Rhizomicrobium sp.]